MVEDSISREIMPKGIHIDSSQIPTNPPTLPNYDWIPLTFLNLELQTAFIPNTRIVSSLLVSQAGLGKTTKLEFLRKFDFVEYVLDITPKHIADFLDDVNDGKKKFLVIPDFIATLGHAKRTTELARSIFRGMTEEGIIKVSIFGMERNYKQPVKAGLISGITTELMNLNSRLWKNDGFYSRFLPFSYSHTPATKNKVLENKRDNINTISMFDMKIKTSNVIEPVRTVDIDNQIKLVTYQLLEPSDAPYRMYDQIVALCKSSAVIRDSATIEQRDIDLVMQLSGFINRRYQPL